jgi:hypothetical protein
MKAKIIDDVKIKQLENFINDFKNDKNSANMKICKDKLWGKNIIFHYTHPINESWNKTNEYTEGFFFVL